MTIHQCGTCFWWKQTGPECGICEALVGRTDVPEWAWRAANAFTHEAATCTCWCANNSWERAMNINDFKARVNNTNDVEVIDDLCVVWLQAKAEEYGKFGKFAKELLSMFQRILS